MQDEPRKHSFFAPVLPGRVDDVGLDGQVVADELGRVGVVGLDAAHLGRGQEHVFRAFSAAKNASTAA